MNEREKFFHYFHMNEILFAIFMNEGNRGNIIIASDDKVFKFLGFMWIRKKLFCYFNRFFFSLFHWSIKIHNNKFLNPASFIFLNCISFI